MSEEKPVRQVGVKIVKADNFGETPTVLLKARNRLKSQIKANS